MGYDISMNNAADTTYEIINVRNDECLGVFGTLADAEQTARNMVIDDSDLWLGIVEVEDGLAIPVVEQVEL